MRCDLGSVDNPSDPPCVRCRREAKECFFSATRRKKKGGGYDDGDLESDPGEVDVYEIKNGRKRLRASTAPDEDDTPALELEQPRTPGGSVGRLMPLQRPNSNTKYGEEDKTKAEQTAALLQYREVHGGHDALKVLHDAALTLNRKTSRDRHDLIGSVVTPGSIASMTSPMVDKVGVSYTTGPLAMSYTDPMWTGRNDGVKLEARAIDTAGYASAIKAWSRFRFVRAGWFTAKEAIDYVEYFYNYLSPLTPVALPDFRPYANHEQLLIQEPMLTVTMLLIASRHMKLEGPGATSRPYSIHQKLWTYLSGMINRVIWGQEQFGGGFCGAGAEPECDVNPLSRKGLRTLGTVESLVLLTEWHPRAMHFPPDEADDELMVPDERLQTPDLNDNSDVPKGIGGQRMDAWLEPCWRSDRMCWMLLGMAMSLAYEIGVFDASEWQRHARSADGHPLSADDLQHYDLRRHNVREILVIYVTQTSGRVGLTSMLPTNFSNPRESDLYNRQVGQHGNLQETVLHFWLRMAELMREGNQRIFPNKAFTRDLIKSGNYKAELEQFLPLLRQWHEDFTRCVAIPKYMRCIMEIEYEYCRVYLNALALQAIAERCANETPVQVIDTPAELARSAMGPNGVRAENAIAPQTLLKWLGGDRKYMNQVGEASRSLLKTVVDDLYPGEYLKHAPVRTYFRIISVTIMLLKSFSLGANENDIADSLALIERTIEALRGCIVDDVHVASRFADLLDTLLSNLKPRLVRVPAENRTGRSRRVSHVGSPEPLAATAGPAVTNLYPLPNQHHHPHHNLSSPSNGIATTHWPFDSNPHTSHNNNNNNNPINPSMYGVSTNPYDLMNTDNNFSIMPPPGFGIHSPSNSTKLNNLNNSGATPGSTGSFEAYASQNAFGPDGTMQDWLALPLDPLLGMTGAEVGNTMYGPELGGQDMLELLLGGGGNGNSGY